MYYKDIRKAITKATDISVSVRVSPDLTVFHKISRTAAREMLEAVMREAERNDTQPDFTTWLHLDDWIIIG